MLRLLVALDFSECSRVALTTAFEVAERAAPAEMLLLTVIPTQPDEVGSLDLAERSVDELRRMVRATRGERATPPGVTVKYTAAQGDAAETIADQARAYDADMVVLGTHGRTGLDRLILGSVAETVVRIAPCSVLTVKPRHRGA